jgi:aminobenzoyl-glutamate utilization protein B
MEVLEPAPPVAHGGSTDTADVSWVCPTVQMHIGNWVVGTPGHSWQSTVQSRSSYAKRSMLFAAKAVAATAMRLMEDPQLVEQAKKEHAEKTPGGYICPIPADVKPNVT